KFGPPSPSLVFESPPDFHPLEQPCTSPRFILRRTNIAHP
ncbi:BgTH12-00856, partial [Blumeria graminis f. sp. triticale]